MADDPSDNNDPPRSRSPWASLRYRDYRLIFFVALFATTAQQMRLTQNLFQVYELSGSAFQLGLTGLAQGIPLFALGLFGGTLADFVDRKKLLLMTTAGNFLVAIALGFLTVSGAIQVWHILVGIALTSALNIILNPTRMALISKLVPRSDLTNAVSLNSSVSQTAHFIGPMIAGVVLEWMDIGNSYLLNALFYLPAACSIILIKTSGAPDGKKERFSTGSFLGGLRFLFSEPIVLALVMLDFIVIGVGYYRSLLPIFAKDILDVGPAGFGILSSAPAVGGTIGTLLLLLIGDVEHKGLLALWSFLAYALGVGFFALSTNFWLSAYLLGTLGLVNSLQAVMRQTTFHLLTPDPVRGRAFAVFNMFSQGANAVGAAAVGFMAALLGAPGSLLFGCVVGSVLTLGCWAALPGLRRFGSEK
ncbi:MAG TPA: MFS transporter [Candidatus Binatia bacterium]|jgi:predicted MFS family arabinose efflux permease|nr:MFS transporter [Candidatus Binatia bacterium]